MIDLRDCEKGDFLISTQGALLQYERPTENGEYLDHKVKYLYTSDGVGEGSYGTRTHDGKVHLKKPKPKIDHDICKIIPQKDAYEFLLKTYQAESVFEAYKHEGETYLVEIFKKREDD